MSRMEMGRTVMTMGIANMIDQDTAFARHVSDSLERYAKCDWGDLDPEDAEMNDLALKNGNDHILAAYEYPGDPEYKIWIITEWDHSATTILFPSEY